MRVMVISGNSLNNYQSCATKYNYEYNHQVAPIEKAAPLEKGDLMHVILESHYTDRRNNLLAEVKKPNVNIINDAVEAGRTRSQELDIPPEDIESVIKQYREYALFYQNENWIPLEIEKPFSKVLYTRVDEFCSDLHRQNGEWNSEAASCPFCKEGLQVLYEGKIDLKIQLAPPQGGIYVVDHKTGSRNEDPSPLSNQFIGYAWALDCSNIIINKIGFQKTLPPAERFRRYVKSYPQEIIEEWVNNTIYWALKIEASANLGFYERNYTSCDKYGGCIFQELCMTTPEAREWKMKSMYSRRAPHDLFR